MNFSPRGSNRPVATSVTVTASGFSPWVLVRAQIFPSPPGKVFGSEKPAWLGLKVEMKRRPSVGCTAIAPTFGWKDTGWMVVTRHEGWTALSGWPLPGREPSPGLMICFFPGATTRVTPAGVRKAEAGTVTKFVVPGGRHSSLSEKPSPLWKKRSFSGWRPVPKVTLPSSGVAACRPSWSITSVSPMVNSEPSSEIRRNW